MKQAPETNGIMELTEEEKEVLIAQLESIKESFEPTEEEPALSIHGLVSRYNDVAELKINGDTAVSLGVL